MVLMRPPRAGCRGGYSYTHTASIAPPAGLFFFPGCDGCFSVFFLMRATRVVFPDFAPSQILFWHERDKSPTDVLPPPPGPDHSSWWTSRRSLFKGHLVIHSGGIASGFKNSTEGDSYDLDGVCLFHVKGSQPDNTYGVQVR